MKQIHPEQILIAALLMVATLAAAQYPGIEPAGLARGIAEKCAAAKQYEFEGVFELSRKSGEGPTDVLAKAKVKLAMAPGGKFLLRVEDVGKSAYVVVSDGQKSWAYVPALKKYTVREAAAAVTSEDLSEGFQDPQLIAKADIIDEFSRRVIPALARLAETPSGTFLNGSAPVKYEGQMRAWPVLTVLSNKDEQAIQSLVYLTVDPTTLTIARIVWIKRFPSTGERVLVRLAIDFDSFRVGKPIADSEFSFSPPQGAKRVDDLPVPGQGGSFLLNKSAPDFELKKLDGNSIHLADFRGRSVLLSFSASWCGPCSRELPALSKIHEEYKDKGLVVLAINQEDKDKAGPSANDANPAFDLLDDSAGKVDRLYRVRSIPTVFLINPKGTVVRVFLGVPDEKTLRSALKNAGL